MFVSGSVRSGMLKSARMSSSGFRPWFLHVAAAVLLLLFAIQIATESAAKSPASDEPPHIAAGLSYVETGIFRANPQHPPLLKELAGLFLRLGGIRWPRNSATENLLHRERLENQHPEWEIGNSIIVNGGPDRVLFWARLPFMLLACALGLTIYIWGSRMLGGPAALGALFLYSLDPIILGHSFLVTMDVGLAAFSVLFLFTLWEYMAKPGRMRLLLCGLALGAVLGAKFSGLFLLPAVVLLLGYGALRRPGTPPPEPAKRKKREPAVKTVRSKRLRRLLPAAAAFAIMCVIAFVAIQALYFFRSGPLAYFDGLRLVNADHEADFEVFLAGEFQRRFTSYFLVAYLLKDPLAGIILAAAGAAVLLASRSIPTLSKLFLLAPPAAVFLGHTLWADNLGVRYLIPALPFAHLLGGLALVALFRSRRTWVRGAAVALAAWAVLAALGVYPDHLAYFNESACLFSDPGKIGFDGGTRCGPAWLADSNVDWGQGFKQLKNWLDRNRPGRTVKVASPFGFPPEAYGIHTEPFNMEELVRRPPPGLYAISAHLVALLAPGATEDNWPQTISPVAIVGHSIFVYNIPRQAAKNGVRRFGKGPPAVTL